LPAEPDVPAPPQATSSHASESQPVAQRRFELVSQVIGIAPASEVLGDIGVSIKGRRRWGHKAHNFATLVWRDGAGSRPSGMFSGERVRENEHRAHVRVYGIAAEAGVEPACVMPVPGVSVDWQTFAAAR
jgi:hypothetical protein